MYCGHCGAENPDEARFCRKCGMPIQFLRHKAAWPVAPDGQTRENGTDRKHVLVRAGPEAPAPSEQQAVRPEDDADSKQRLRFQKAFADVRAKKQNLITPELPVLELNNRTEALSPAGRKEAATPELPVLELEHRIEDIHDSTPKRRSVPAVPCKAPNEVLPTIQVDGQPNKCRVDEPADVLTVSIPQEVSPSASSMPRQSENPARSFVRADSTVEEPLLHVPDLSTVTDEAEADIDAEDAHENPESFGERSLKAPQLLKTAALSVMRSVELVRRLFRMIFTCAGLVIRFFWGKVEQAKEARAARRLLKKERAETAGVSKVEKAAAAKKAKAERAAARRAENIAQETVAVAQVREDAEPTDPVAGANAKQNGRRFAAGIFHRQKKDPEPEEAPLKMAVSHVEHEDPNVGDIETDGNATALSWKSIDGLAAAAISSDGGRVILPALSLIQYIFESSLQDDDAESWGETPENLEKKRGVTNLDRRKVLIMIVATLIGIAVIYFSIAFMFPQNGGGRIFG